MMVKIRRDADPFKKYWWVLLVVFGVVGLGFCLPLFEGGGGTSPAAHEEGVKSAEDSLDAVNNPNGAPGGAVDLSMDGAGSSRKKGDGTLTSSLYEAPGEAAASGGPVAPAGGSLANALKFVSQKSETVKQAAAAKDASGWSGEKAQRGFVAPKAAFGGMGGLGSVGGSSGGGGGGPAGSGAFGAENAHVGFASTRGLGSDDHGPTGKGGGATMNALRSAQSASIAAVGQKSNDAAAAMAGKSFDGRAAGGGAIGGGGQSDGGGGYAGLDAAPANLKSTQTNFDKSKIDVAPPVVAPSVDPNQQMRDMVLAMIISMIMGGITGGIMGAMGMGGAGMMGGMGGTTPQGTAALQNSPTVAPATPR